MILIYLIHFVAFMFFSIFMVFILFIDSYDVIVIGFVVFWEVKYIVIIENVTPIF